MTSCSIPKMDSDQMCYVNSAYGVLTLLEGICEDRSVQRKLTGFHKNVASCPLSHLPTDLPSLTRI